MKQQGNAEQTSVHALRLHSDSEPVRQPEGSYPFALNVVLSHRHKGSLTAEAGNQKKSALPGRPVGSITLDRHRTVLFCEGGYIVEIEDDIQYECRMTIHVSHPGLAFDQPITGQHRVVRGCEDVIYWCDGVNEDRFFNLTRPEKFKNQKGGWDLNKFSFAPDIAHPKITTDILETGGNLRYGNYFFVVELLDDFENLLFRSPVSIDYTPISNNIEQGAYNLDNISPEGGGQPSGGKSIELNITQLDTVATLARIVVIRAVSGDGLTSDAHVVGQLFPLTSHRLNYVYRGFSVDRGDYAVDLNRALAPNIIYQTSHVMEQVHSRLLRGNLIESVRDYSNYQQYASRICSKYVVSRIERNDANRYFKNQTEIGGQVRAKGIVYVHRDGSVSPVFHIPGPASRGDTIIDTGEEFEPVGFTFSGIDSYTDRNTDDRAYWVQFTFELERPVPNLRMVMAMCGISSGNKRREEDFGPLPTSGSTIREEFPLSGNAGCTYADLTFYSANIFIGTVRIHFNSRDEIKGTFEGATGSLRNDWELTNTAVKDTEPDEGYYSSGRPGYWLTSQKYTLPNNYTDCRDTELPGNDYWGQDCDGNNLLGEQIRHHVVPDRSLEPLYDDEYYYKIGFSFSNIIYPNDDIVGHYFVTSDVEPGSSNINSKGYALPYFDNVVFANDNGNYYFSNQPPGQSRHYHVITLEHLLGANLFPGGSPGYMIQEGEITLANECLDGNCAISYNNFFDGSSLDYEDLVIEKQAWDFREYNTSSNFLYVIDNLYRINRRSEFSELLNKSFTNPFQIIRLNEERNTPNRPRYVALKSDGRYLDNLYTIRYRRYTELSENSSFAGDGFISQIDLTNISYLNINERSFFEVIFFADTTIRARFELLSNMVFESRINGFLRVQGTNDNNYYDRSTTDFNFILRQLVEKFTEQAGKDKYKMRSLPLPLWTAYNPDYSRLSDYNQYLPLPITYNYCSKCIGIYPHRIIFSQVSRGEDLEDNYRRYLANDYKDMPANTGGIFGIDFKDNRLIIRTEESAYITTVSPQQLQLSETTVDVGTGGFLSLIPQIINTDPLGYGGQQAATECNVNEQGLYWVDRRRGRVFMLAGQIRQISDEGIENWLRENLSGDTLVQVAYDAVERRVLFARQGRWTLSCKHNVWVSWHSWLPQWIFSTAQALYSAYNSTLYQHGAHLGIFHRFYDQDFPMIIEYTLPSWISFDTDAIHFYTKAYTKIADGSLQDQYKITFDQIVISNSFQSTGQMNLRLLDDGTGNFRYDDGVLHCIETAKTYKVSRIFDKAIATPVWQRIDGPALYDPADTVEGFIDKIPLNVDPARPQALQGRFRDKHISIRLIHRRSDYRIVIDLLQTLKYYMQR